MPYEIPFRLRDVVHEGRILLDLGLKLIELRLLSFESFPLTAEPRGALLRISTGLFGKNRLFLSTSGEIAVNTLPKIVNHTALFEVSHADGETGVREQSVLRALLIRGE
jgi:hypothetical protein